MPKKKKEKDVDDRIAKRLMILEDFRRRLENQLAGVISTITELRALQGDDYYPEALNPSVPIGGFAAPAQTDEEEKE